MVATKLQCQVDVDQHPKAAITVRQAVTHWLDVAEHEDTTRERYDDLIRRYILPTSATSGWPDPLPPPGGACSERVPW